MNRKTDIMATVSDVRCTDTFIKSLRGAGVDSIRINSAHVEPDTLRQMIRTIRSAGPGMKILMDTKGPEIRTVDNARPGEDIQLSEGTKLKIGFGGECSDAYIGINVDPELLGLRNGDRLTIDDGLIELRVDTSDDRELMATVMRGGHLGSRKTVGAPDHANDRLPAVSERDERNILAGCEEGIDMIAHSFVRNADDVKAVRKLIERSGIELFAKIECKSALVNIDQIADEADGLLIARGDLGSQIDFTAIPLVQKEIARRFRNCGKQIILATQMMQSMIENPLPTRAEVQDVANAVEEGINILLLTGETAQGRFPLECVATMRKIIERTEEYLLTGHIPYIEQKKQ